MPAGLAGAMATERVALNDFAIGIELEGDEVSPYRGQYRTLAAVTRQLLAAYPALAEQRITGHAHVAPLRKSDPGPAFDWAYFRQTLRKLTHSVSGNASREGVREWHARFIR
jgi:N-acetyl-anhydromuramoyl-L-alanine amidase